MSRGFTMVSPAIWESERFLRLDSDGRVLALYFVCGPHQRSSGCARVKEGYATADLGWTAKQYQTALKAICAAGVVTVEGDEVYVERWFKHCAPTNLKHGKGAMTSISKIESDVLREKAEEDFAATEWGAKSMQQAADQNNPLGPSRLTDTPFMQGQRR
jgi:hypothetical protein